MHCYIGYKLSYEADAEKSIFDKSKYLLLLMVCITNESNKLKVKVFPGVELHYRDLFHGKIYELLQKLTSGIK